MWRYWTPVIGGSLGYLIAKSWPYHTLIIDITKDENGLTARSCHPRHGEHVLSKTRYLNWSLTEGLFVSKFTCGDTSLRTFRKIIIQFSDKSN
jgi:hypothetical protein